MNGSARQLRWLPYAAVVACGIGAQPALAVDFAREVRPILSNHCFPCHGPDAEDRKADLRFDTPSSAFGSNGAPGPIVPGDPESSVAWNRIISTDPDEQMPPPEAHLELSPEKVAVLREWILEGAPWDEHWAFAPIADPEPPKDLKPLSPIDRFLARAITARDMQEAAQATPREWIRRVTLDLTGLPPSPEDVTGYLEDSSPAAKSRVVDRLLESPQFGERMVWEWLDAARYADSNGYQGDRERTMWPWRDWAVAALNHNMPFDQFTVEQLAGDLVPDARPEQVLATGFLRNHMINGEGGRIPEENRVDYVMDMTETVGTVWLGLTFNCCRCHDHKYDPIPQSDYYRLSAFFNQTPVNGGGGDPQTAPNLAVPSLDQKLALAQHAAAIAENTQRIEAYEAENEWPDEEALSAFLNAPVSGRSSDDLEKWATHFDQTKADYSEALRRLKSSREARDRTQRSVPKVMVMADRTERRETFILNRGLYNQPGDAVEAGVPTALPPLNDIDAPNRLDLAQWLVRADHPLTARVTVNRMWQTFFGAGLVRTPGDFGSQGQPPSHPELLDWLARRFIDSGWDVKGLIREMVLSEAYGRSARVSPEALAVDPENQWLARAPRHRLPSWMIRDQALAAAGLLSSRLGGAPVNGYQPVGVWEEFTFGKKTYRRDEGEKLYRRSLYTFWRRIIGPTIFFDAAKRQTCEVVPKRTNTPLQALVTLNGDTYVEAARWMARRALEQGDANDGIEWMFQRLLARAPEPEEVTLLNQRFQILLSAYADQPEQAHELLSVGASPVDPTLNPAAFAAMTAVANIVLNLDETLNRP